MRSTRSIAVHPVGPPAVRPLPNGRYGVEMGCDVVAVYADRAALVEWAGELIFVLEADAEARRG